MTTNCFDVVSLFDLKNNNRQQQQMQRRTGWKAQLWVYLWMYACVCVWQVENGFVTSKGLKACSFVWLTEIYENEAKMCDEILERQGGKG